MSYRKGMLYNSLFNDSAVFKLKLPPLDATIYNSANSYYLIYTKTV